MRFFLIIPFLLASFISTFAQIAHPELRDELLAMKKIDQEERVKCMVGDADSQIRCLEKIATTIDAPNTKRLEAIVEKHGFPNTKMVSKDGFGAFMLALQHSTSDALREKSEKPISKAFKRKELSPQDYANFIDRLRLRQGKAQIYGSGFETKDGKLVLSKTDDVKNLDKLRGK